MAVREREKECDVHLFKNVNFNSRCRHSPQKQIEIQVREKSQTILGDSETQLNYLLRFNEFIR